MEERHLHIVLFDVPYPADYGGAIEQFYKIVWLHRLGIKIHLHCFTNKRSPSAELDKHCEEIHYYKRTTGFKGFSFTIPYIVASRNDEALLTNLQKDNYPILFEGMHTTYLLHQHAFNNRKLYVRLHNAEFSYYHQLAKHENNSLKKIYYLFESFLLKKYEADIAKSYDLLALSKTDEAIFKEKFAAKNVQLLPAFVGWEEVTSQQGKGCYCLYHGNLSINENEEAAVWLMEDVFNDLALPLVIAGKDPSARLEKIAHEHEDTCLVANPGKDEMQDIIAKAHVNIVPSLNNTGIKLKLLNALYSGRHCVVNKEGVKGSGLEELCVVADGAEGFKAAIKNLYKETFEADKIVERKALLQQVNSNEKNAKRIIELFWH